MLEGAPRSWGGENQPNDALTNMIGVGMSVFT